MTPEMNTLLLAAAALGVMLFSVTGAWVMYKIARLLDRMEARLEWVGEEDRAAGEPETNAAGQAAAPPAPPAPTKSAVAAAVPTTAPQPQAAASPATASTAAGIQTVGELDLDEEKAEAKTPAAGKPYVPSRPPGTGSGELKTISGRRVPVGAGPIVYTCADCGKQYRLRNPGTYMCKCGKRFTAE